MPGKIYRILWIAVAVIVLLPAGITLAASSGIALEQGFETPPDTAKPWVWWHWVDENVSKEGITKDLEWMKRIGVGGFQMFDTGLNLGTFVEEPVRFRSSEWYKLLRHAAAEADRLGLGMAMQSDSGSSTTGGTWVTPEQAMKKYVWSEQRVTGPTRYTAPLPQPPQVNGTFQNLENAVADGFFPSRTNAAPDPTYYADSAVVAYRLPKEDVRMADLDPKATSHSGDLDPAPLVDGDTATSVTLPAPDDGAAAYIQFEFSKPFTAGAFTFAGRIQGNVKVSDNGTDYRLLTELPSSGGRRMGGGSASTTITFPAVGARFYRLEITGSGGGFFGPGGPGRDGGAPNEYTIGEMQFFSPGRVNRWEDKTYFGSLYDFEKVPTTLVSPDSAVSKTEVIDLSSRMTADGTLTWDVPEGDWIILRLGYSLTGRKNHPAMPTAEGFEVDKLNKAHVTSYIHEYLDPVAEALGPLYGTSFNMLLIDSWEAGMLNWSSNMPDEFRTRRGYDPTPWLPVLTGRGVESAESSDRFLWDYRRTISDMIADNHYGTIADYLHERGILLTSEAAGLGMPTLEDGLLNKGKTDIPMAEFWMQGFPDGRTLRDEDEADVREAASAAHIYGTNIAAAESFTTIGVSAWEHTPAYLKWAADYTMSLGLNRFVIHTSAHQPFERKPGMTLDVAGQHFSRHTTWAELAGPWMTYLARSSYMLQQGLFVADLCYYYGESTPVTVPATTEISPAPPAGYSYDFLNTEVLLNRLKVVDGRLVLPGGMSYRVLLLPETDRMTPRVSEKIRELVSAGAVVVGPKPSRSPSLSGRPAADEKVTAVAAEVWGNLDGKARTRRSFGKGRVIWGESLARVLSGEDIAPDVTFTGSREDDTPVWIHRRAGDTEIFFIANITDREITVRADFRVDGKAPELWHPDTGTTEPAEYAITSGRTEVPLELAPSGSVFVVFRQEADAPSRKLSKTVENRLGAIEGAWDVHFPSAWGAPEQIHLDELISWTEHSTDGVKYFSGTAVYTREIEAPAEWFLPEARIVLDLGKVEEFAEVSVNGTPLGILWKPPYRVDVTDVLKQEKNILEIKITNTWLNRLIGDLDLPKSERYTFTSALESSHTSEAEYKASPLSPSGLLGPVTVLTVTNSN